MDYADFIEAKTQLGQNSGFDPVWMPDYLLDHQPFCTEWAIRKGRAALYEDCGLGKTIQELVFAQNVVQHTNKPVLLATPLAVSYQTIAEAGKFGIESYLMREAPLGTLKPAIYVTNYERLHYFNPHDFAGMVCDESAILKNIDGKRRTQITEFMRKMRYRLLATATAAPNDYTELGTSSEALGELGMMDMLNRFFKNDMNNSANGRMRGEVIKWRFKGHAEQAFWQWVCSWALAVRKPSDLGFSDERYILPPLTETQHLVETRTVAEGFLFALPAVGLKEQREERRRTVEERCDKAASLVNHTSRPFVVWADLNDEGDYLESIIPDAIQVSGKDSDDAKEEKLMQFADGKVRGLITKKKIGAWGLNFQHCAHSVQFPSHSYEQYYQSIRRFWRFGQQRPVQSDIVTTEGAQDTMANLQRKAKQADRMFDSLVAEMNRAQHIDRSRYQGSQIAIPAWMEA